MASMLIYALVSGLLAGLASSLYTSRGWRWVMT